ncbi:hypothetical protein [Paenibacillus herberti]|uniref:Uncharacterized protein n=1 Tax=Paenibacillus herberti TaxID=1619309 RepID=A0A229NVR7_9BACL|nr:hypothetical protein [Paenibacillus herberti]OXM13729.1 hypothetical protein CGZ75_22185 [Paenibacillus herberti]
MRFSEHFHCLGCEKLLPENEASVLFRTGYYRVSHPLGCCQFCDGAGSGESTGKEHSITSAKDISQSRFAYYSISA